MCFVEVAYIRNAAKLTKGDEMRYRKFTIADRSAIHLGTLALNCAGVSALGAQQFLACQPVTSAQDRRRLAMAIIDDLIKKPIPGGPIPIPYPNTGTKG